MSRLLLPPLSLYVHLPWCERKCPYCDFNSYQADHIDEGVYIDSLIEDLHYDLPLVWGRQVISVFIGGGTPSLFSGEAIAQLLSNLRACLNLNPAIEITLEANPGSADATRFRTYREAGINRLSLGIQSFNDDMLRRIGRVHDAATALAAYEHARAAGFDNINLDLMYGLPGQSVEQAVADLQQAMALEPEHLSHYQLTIEPNTQFHAQPPAAMADDEAGWLMQSTCQQQLSDSGFRHYEISAYAKPGRECRHNLNYWEFGDYVGIGAGAHGKITLPGENRIIRTTRKRQPRSWMHALAEDKTSARRSLQTADLVFEFMLNNLRLVEGFDKHLFSEYCGLHYGAIAPIVTDAIETGLLQEDGNRLKPTSLGLRFLNDLQARFLDVEISTFSTTEPIIHFKS